MKILIWILTFFVGTILNTLLGYATGIKAGTVLLYIVEFYIAKKLCSMWDDRKGPSIQQGDDRTKIANNETNNLPEEPPHEDPASPTPVDSIPVKMKTRFCRHCGFELVDGSKFCSKCGTKTEEEKEI